MGKQKVNLAPARNTNTGIYDRENPSLTSQRGNCDWQITVGMERTFREKVSADLVRKAALAALRISAQEQNNGKFEISLFLTDEAGIADLNKKYRNKDGPTDVLSFSYTESRRKSKSLFVSPVPRILIGEIVLCYPYIRSQAKSEGQNITRALAWTTIHGVLHLLGRKHYRKTDRQIMQSEERAALSVLGLQGGKEN